MTSSRSDLPINVEFEPEFISALHDIDEEKILFNQWMGLKFVSVQATGIVASLAMKPELVGHFAHYRIHGGKLLSTGTAANSLLKVPAIG